MRGVKPICTSFPLEFCQSAATLYESRSYIPGRKCGEREGISVSHDSSAGDLFRRKEGEKLGFPGDKKTSADARGLESCSL
jgi:hypothetical protein